MSRGRYPQIDPLTRYEVDDNSGCWNWTGPTNSKGGYGTLKIAQGTGWSKLKRAHVYFWEFENGPVPDGLELHHICGNKKCVNPAHLELMSHIEHAYLHRDKKCGDVKLSMQDARDIRIRYSKGGITQNSLAKLYDVSLWTIKNICLNKIWKE